MSGHEEITRNELYRRLGFVAGLIVVAAILGGILGRWSVPDNTPATALKVEEPQQETEEPAAEPPADDKGPLNHGYHLYLSLAQQENADALLSKVYPIGVQEVVLETLLLTEPVETLSKIQAWKKTYPHLRVKLRLKALPVQEWLSNHPQEELVGGHTNLTSTAWQDSCKAAIAAWCNGVKEEKLESTVTAMILEPYPTERLQVLSDQIDERGIKEVLPESLQSEINTWTKKQTKRTYANQDEAFEYHFQAFYAQELANSTAALLAQVKELLPDISVYMHYGNTSGVYSGILQQAAQLLQESDLVGYSLEPSMNQSAIHWTAGKDWIIIPQEGEDQLGPQLLSSWLVAKAIAEQSPIALPLQQDWVDPAFLDELEYLINEVPILKEEQPEPIDDVDLLIVQTPGGIIEFGAYAGVHTAVVTIDEYLESKTPPAKLYAFPFDWVYTPQEMGLLWARFQAEKANVIWYRGTQLSLNAKDIQFRTMLPIQPVEAGVSATAQYRLEGLWLGMGDPLAEYASSLGLRIVGEDHDTLVALGDTDNAIAGMRYQAGKDWTSIFVGMAPMPPLLLREILAIQEIPTAIRPHAEMKQQDAVLRTDEYILVRAGALAGDRTLDLNGAVADVIDCFNPEVGWHEVSAMTVHFEAGQTRLLRLSTP